MGAFCVLKILYNVFYAQNNDGDGDRRGKPRPYSEYD